MDKHIILIKDQFNRIYGAVTCNSHGNKIKNALEDAAVRHSNSDNEGGDIIRYLMAYLPDDLKDKIIEVVRDIMVVNV